MGVVQVSILICCLVIRNREGPEKISRTMTTRRSTRIDRTISQSIINRLDVSIDPFLHLQGSSFAAAVSPAPSSSSSSAFLLSFFSSPRAVSLTLMMSRMWEVVSGVDDNDVGDGNNGSGDGRVASKWVGHNLHNSFLFDQGLLWWVFTFLNLSSDWRGISFFKVQKRGAVWGLKDGLFFLKGCLSGWLVLILEAGTISNLWRRTRSIFSRKSGLLFCFFF